jgi:hypothetical protein
MTYLTNTCLLISLQTIHIGDLQQDNRPNSAPSQMLRQAFNTAVGPIGASATSVDQIRPNLHVPRRSQSAAAGGPGALATDRTSLYNISISDLNLSQFSQGTADASSTYLTELLTEQNIQVRDRSMNTPPTLRPSTPRIPQDTLVSGPTGPTGPPEDPQDPPE